MNKFLLSLVFFSLLAFTYSDQDLDQELKKVNEVFLKLDHVAFEVTYNYYADHTTKNLIQSEKGEIKKSGNSIHQDIMGVESIINDDLKIILLHEEQAILVDSSFGYFSPLDLSEENIQASLDYASSVETFLTNGIKEIRFLFDDYYYDRLSIYYNQSSYLMHELSIYFNEQYPLVDEETPNPRLDFEFRNYRFTPLSRKVFESSSYLIIEDNNITPATEYKDYKLYNLIFKN